MSATRVIFHVDMDAFFASVEVRDNPQLRGKPVLVGGVGNRGVVAAASYEARVYGCHSAQPMAIAVRRCPHAIVLPSRFDAYQEASDRVFEIFDRFSPSVEALSVDEAFLEMTGSERLLGAPRRAAEDLRATVRGETGGLTCSVGIAAVKFVAKIASAIDKPDGLTEVPPGQEHAFLDPLTIAKLWGIGPVTEAKLRERGIGKIADLREITEATLTDWFGEHGTHLHRLSHAIDPRVVEPGRARKQVSHEDTYATDVEGESALCRKLLSQSTRVADRLVRKRTRGRRVQLKIRDNTFKTETRQLMLEVPTREAAVIYEAACRLLQAVDLQDRRFRLTGVSVSALVHDDDLPPRQLDLLDPQDPEPRGERLQGVLSAVRERFGHQALFPADAGPDQRPGSAGGFTTSIDVDEDREG